MATSTTGTGMTKTMTKLVGYSRARFPITPKIAAGIEQAEDEGGEGAAPQVHEQEATAANPGLQSGAKPKQGQHVGKKVIGVGVEEHVSQQGCHAFAVEEERRCEAAVQQHRFLKL